MLALPREIPVRQDESDVLMEKYRLLASLRVALAFVPFFLFPVDKYGLETLVDILWRVSKTFVTY